MELVFRNTVREQHERKRAGEQNVVRDVAILGEICGVSR